MESRFLEPPRETEIGSRNREFEIYIGGKITVKQIKGNDFWFELSRFLGLFEKSRVREIEIPLKMDTKYRVPPTR